MHLSCARTDIRSSVVDTISYFVSYQVFSNGKLVVVGSESVDNDEPDKHLVLRSIQEKLDADHIGKFIWICAFNQI